MKVRELLKENNIKVGDIVRLLDYSKGDANANARVTGMASNGVKVTNMNMPFQGTLSNKFFPFHKVEKIKTKVSEKMNNWIAKYSKGIENFILWQDNHYYYSLKQAAQSPGGSFKTIKNFDDMSLDEVDNWLSGAGYKKQELKENLEFGGWEINDKSFVSKGFDPTLIQKYILKNKDDTKEITISEIFGDWTYSERYSKFSKDALKSKDLDQFLKRDGAPSFKQIKKSIADRNEAYHNDPFGHPSKYESKSIKDDLLEGPVNYDMFAKRKAAENKERLAKQREQERKEKIKTASVKKELDAETRYKRGQLTDAELTKVEMMVHDAIGQTFPDSEPMDVLYPKLKRMFGEFNVNKILDVVSKKRLGSKNWYKFLADNWDENMEAFADLHPEYKKMKNPWK